MTACVIVLFAIAHTAGHGSNYHYASIAKSADELNAARGEYRWFDLKEVPTLWQFLLTTVPSLTGYIMWIVFILIFSTAFFAKVRQKNFELFWYVHHLFFLYYAMLAVHGLEMILGDFPTAWTFVLIPCLIYGYQRIMRVIRARRDTRVINSRTWRTRVVNLVLKRPKSFRYRAGQYAFVNCPSISRLQWHPFTLTSSPEEKEHISFHIRALGDWTKAMYEKVNAEKESSSAADKPLGEHDSLGFTVRVDGPYGAPSEDFYDYDRIILIGAGIGVTPFISIMKDIKMKWDRKASNFRVGRAYFFWVNGDQDNLLWFSDVLKDLMALDGAEGLIKIRTYLSGALAHTDMRAFLLWHILTWYYESKCIDPITGLPSRTYWGHPDWNDIFKSFKVVLKKKGPQRVGVFYCGPEALAADIYNAVKSNSGRTVTFVWHKENF